jgi:hypothetical protein
MSRSRQSSCRSTLSLAKARTKILLGLLLVLIPDSFSSLDVTGSWPATANSKRHIRSSVHLAEALSLPFNLFARNSVDRAQLLTGINTTTKESVSHKGVDALVLKNNSGRSAGPGEKGVASLFQGTGQSLGQWDLVGVSGVSAMHATLIPNTNKIVFLEKVEKSAHAYLAEDPSKFSWSVEYDIDAATFRSLHSRTNMFCSAGGYRPDGVSKTLSRLCSMCSLVAMCNYQRTQLLQLLDYCVLGRSRGSKRRR